ncbi:MAG TPA: rhomboid family intramembrane serine protease [Gemmatimonadaceae bacterium]|nr:rhomboid family intramembrane serine protease [Gemmatimonadaceae bacterium]
MAGAVRWLLAANIAVHFLQLVVFGTGNTFTALAFDSSALPGGWWTLATYMFVHAGLVHLALNLFMLWSFGPRLEETWGTRSFVTFYLWCGLGGAITHLLVVRAGHLVGASAAIYGIMLAYATLWKDEEIYIFGVVPMKARWLIIWMIAVNLVYAVVALQGLTSVAAFAHLGGLVFAWLYLHVPGGSALSKVKDRIASVPDDTGEMPRVVPKQTRRGRERMSLADEVVARSKAVSEQRMLDPSDGPGAPRGIELDALLDKISQFGLDSLTAAERRLLEERSRELRKGDQ